MTPIDRAREAATLKAAEVLKACFEFGGARPVRDVVDEILAEYNAALSAEGMVVVREAVLAEKIARLMCGFDLHPDNMVPISNPNDPWGDPIGEQTMWEANMPAARAMIAAASQGDGT